MAKKQLRRRYGVQKAIEWILRSGDGHEPAILPRVDDLCARIGVSRGTLLRAIKELKAAGRIVRAAGKSLALCATGAAGDPPEPAPAERPRDRMRAAIESDVLNGRFKPGVALPSLKELQTRYGASYRSIKNALGVLVAAGNLDPQGRGYAVPMLRAAQTFATIVLVEKSDLEGHITLGMHDAEWLSALRLECARNGLTLDTITFTPGEPAPVLRRPGSAITCALPAGRSVLGYLYLIHSGTCFQRRIFDSLHSSGKPVAILDEYGVVELPELARRNSSMRIFRMTVSTFPGRQMAQFLLQLGHRRIAFISPTHQMIWAQRRFEGCAQTFRAAGCEEGIVPFLLHRVFNRTDTTDPCIAEIHRKLREMTQCAPAHLRREMAGIEDAAEIDALRRAEARRTLCPVFETVAQTPGITAIAAVNDATGVLALEFCRVRHIPIPKRLSIVSFDDTNESLECNLTSYNFNIAGTALAMLRSVIDPRAVGKSGPVIEIEGAIVARGSSAPLPHGD